MDLFGIHGDPRGGRRRWTTFAWPLLGAMVGALLGLLAAPPLAHALRSVLGVEARWLMPLLVLLAVAGMVAAFVALGRRGRADAAR